MIDKIFKIILLFTPIAYCVGVPFYRFELLYFQIASMVLVVSALYDTQKREFNLKKLLTLFLGICFFSVITNKFNLRSVSALINVFLGCLDIYIITIHVENIKKCFKWLLVGVIINSLICTGQFNGIHSFVDPSMIGSEFGGIVGNSPRFATMLTVCVGFVNPLLLPVLAISGFMLTECIVTFASLIVFTVKLISTNLLGYKVKYLIASLLALGLLIFIYLCKNKIIFNPCYGVRFDLWKTMLTNLAQRPLIGYGLGNFEVADFGFSSFFQWIYGVGVLGFGFIFICIKRMKLYLLPILLLCLVEYPFEIPRLWMVLVFAISYYAIDQKEDILC